MSKRTTNTDALLAQINKLCASCTKSCKQSYQCIVVSCSHYNAEPKQGVKQND